MVMAAYETAYGMLNAEAVFWINGLQHSHRVIN